MTGQLALGVLAAAIAAACYDGAVALQAAEARVTDADLGLRPSLLARLIRRRRWLGGTLLGALGWPFQLVALSLAPLTVVQPTLAVGLVLLLFLGARWLHEPVGRLEIAGTAAIILGVAGLALAAPAHTDSHAAGWKLALVFGLLGVLMIAPYIVGASRATGLMLVVSAGGAYTIAAITSKLITDELARGTVAGVVLWTAATGVTGIIGILSEMTGLQRLGATQVAAPVFVVQAVVPVLAAPLLAGEHWSDTPGGGSLLLLSLAAVAAGATALGRSSAIRDLVAGSRK
jgi:drug/metabolite transporter (DMT)-like permease